MLRSNSLILWSYEILQDILNNSITFDQDPTTSDRYLSEIVGMHGSRFRQEIVGFHSWKTLDTVKIQRDPVELISEYLMSNNPARKRSALEFFEDFMGAVFRDGICRIFLLTFLPYPAGNGGKIQGEIRLFPFLIRILGSCTETIPTYFQVE